MNYKKSTNDFREDLNFHLKYIVKCCHEFDEGDRESMAHVTTNLRVLLKHNPPNTISLLNHLELTEIDFVDIAGVGNPVSLAPMFGGSISVFDFSPKLNTDDKPWIPFSDWYRGLVLFAKSNYEFSREDIIKNLGEKYVQHIDKKVPKDFHLLFKNISDYVGWVSFSEGIKIKQPNIVYSVIRMICHEILVTIQNNKLTSLNLEKIYFSKLRDVKPYSPFGEYRVSLLQKSDISLQFFCLKDGELRKLPISGEYGLAHHKEKVQDRQKYAFDVVDEIIHKKVYSHLENEANIVIGEQSFPINEYIDIDTEMFAVVHHPTQKYQLVDKILFTFEFKVIIEKADSK